MLLKKSLQIQRNTYLRLSIMEQIPNPIAFVKIFKKTPGDFKSQTNLI